MKDAGLYAYRMMYKPASFLLKCPLKRMEIDSFQRKRVIFMLKIW